MAPPYCKDEGILRGVTPKGSLGFQLLMWHFLHVSYTHLTGKAPVLKLHEGKF